MEQTPEFGYSPFSKRMSAASVGELANGHVRAAAGQRFALEVLQHEVVGAVLAADASRSNRRQERGQIGVLA